MGHPKHISPFNSIALAVSLALASVPTSWAGDILRGGTAAAQTNAPTATSGSTTAQAARAQANAADALARTTAAIRSVQAMQASARKVALAGSNNLGKNPNFPGQILPNVPNGLVIGGLQVALGVPIDLAHPTVAENPTLWTGARLPTQTVSGGKTRVTIVQTQSQALLNWKTFNIGKKTAVTFDQKAGGKDAGKWIAFNQINDPSGNPTQILGSLDAIGQIYLINQNGIIFGGSSQVNTHNLTASSLPINTNLINQGLLNNRDAQFLFSALSIAAGGNGTPAFTPPTPLTPGGIRGNVTVQTGAKLTAATTADHVGGRIALIAPNVTNSGVLSTPDGQTILAAGQQVGFVAHASSDPSLRGLDVFVGAVDSTSGLATNYGLISVPRADVTMVGKKISQSGVIDGSTSVALNGRVDLLGNYNSISSGGLPNLPLFLPRAAGEVTFGTGSVTQILPESASMDRVVGSRLALPSLVNVQGNAIHMVAGATMLAPGARAPVNSSGTLSGRDGNGAVLADGITLNAGIWNYLPSSGGPLDTFVNAGGQIYLEPNSTINVSGSMDVTAPASENIVSVQLRGAELADSPSQRFGALRGQTIQIDVRQQGTYNGFTWIGTPLADASGYANLIQRTVGELTIGGGTVSLKAGGSIVMQPGSSVDVSGGWINYQGGLINTTRLISDGHFFDISQATPDRIYSGIYDGKFSVDHAKYGITEIFTNPLANTGHYEPDYVFGGNGGQISIAAPAMALDGELLGQTVDGPRQRTVLPDSSGLLLKFAAQTLSAASQNSFPFYSPTPPTITFQDTRLTPVGTYALDASGNPAPLLVGRTSEVFLSPNLVSQDGFGKLTIDNSDGSIFVPAGVTLQAAPNKGALTFSAANIDIEGNIRAPGGTLSFTVYDFTPFQLPDRPVTETPVPDANRGHFTLGSSASLITAGLIVDDRQFANAPFSMPLSTKGGSITIKTYDAALASGSVIDVSGGVAVSADNKRVYGDAGSIDIAAGQDPKIASILGGKLLLDTILKGYSGSKGGSLTLLAPLVQIGGTSSQSDTLTLQPGFFSSGGFTSFTLKGLGATTSQPGQYLPGVVVAANTVARPVAQSWLAVSGLKGDIDLTPIVLPEGLRTPVSITLEAVGVSDAFNITNPLVVRGDLIMEVGSFIQTDPKANISFKGQTAAILGSVIAPGGNIFVTGAQSSRLIFAAADAVPTVELGPHSFLSTAGVTLLTPDPRGYRTGSVLPGGTISISGNIVAEAGSVLDVSGTSDVLDLPVSLSSFAQSSSVGITPVFTGSLIGGVSVLPTYGFAGTNAPLNGSLSGNRLIPIKVDSNAGTISLKGAQELFTDATLIGKAGGPGAQGGTLSLSSGRADGLQTALDVTLLVKQSGNTLPASFHDVAATAIGQTVTDGHGNTIAGLGYFAADRFSAGDFDALELKGVVQFTGRVNISADRSLSVASGGSLFADSRVTLSAPHVTLGTNFQAPLQALQLPVSAFQSGSEPFYFQPTFGPGRLTVVADLIDIGNLSLQNIGSARFIADGGDIRGDGTLDVAGDILMRAGQVYPATGVSFTIAAYDHSGIAGSVTFDKSGSRQLPFSAGGQLNVYGSIINQGGVLRAPQGTINLGWDGVGSSPKDIISGAGILPGSSLAATSRLTLSNGSITSVSAIDPLTGQGLLLPYGLNLNGTAWIDPAGNDITAGGVPAKTISISARNVSNLAGSVIDLRGGGDLYAYRFVPGIGGTKDILASSSSFAIIPGYQADYAPYAPFNPNPATDNLGGDVGYVNGKLSAGDRIYLGASNGLPAGNYTLLPARYALLPGAFLVTPQTGVAVGSVSLSTGSNLVSGYQFNGTQKGQPLIGRFEVSSSEVVRSRAQYEDSLANVFLRDGALKNNSTVPRLPIDSGRLTLEAIESMMIQGSVLSQPPAGGRGSLIDISSPVDILVAGRGVHAASPGTLVLNVSELNSFGAASLLLGGIRRESAAGTSIQVATNNLTVDNSATPFRGQDIILVANQHLTLAAGASITSIGSASEAGTLLLRGNGTLLRVSSDPSAKIIRSNVDPSVAATMDVGAGVRLTGGGIILDSTNATHLDSTASILGRSVTLDSGLISLQLNNPSGHPAPSPGGLVLSGQALLTLQTSASSLSLLSYSSIDIYGTGNVGGLDSSGRPKLVSLALHAADLRGFDNEGGVVSFNAQTILLDNSPGLTASGSDAPSGTLQFNANIIQLGANALEIDQYAAVELNASGGLLATATGSFSTQGSLSIATPLITGTKGAKETILSAGALNIQATAATSNSRVAGGLGASLTLVGSSITDNGNIALFSGALTLHATTGDILVGNISSSLLDVSGTKQSFFDLTKYTNGGSIQLIADLGSVELAAGSVTTVAAQPDGGNAGTLGISVPNGTFSVAGQLLGTGGGSGRDGAFTLDAATMGVSTILGGNDLTSLEQALNAGSFTESQSIRIRGGVVNGTTYNDVFVEGSTLQTQVHARKVSISSDKGSLTVAGIIDASGPTGGRIDLAASGSVTLLSGSVLTAAGEDFDNAGKGGAVSLEAGSEIDGIASSTAFVDIQTGSTIDLSVASNTSDSAAAGQFTGTLHLRAPQDSAATDLQIHPINGTILNASSIVVEGYQIFDASADGSIDNQEAAVYANGQAFTNAADIITSRILAQNAALAAVTHVRPGAEIINRIGDLTLANDWDLATYRFGPNADPATAGSGEPGILLLRARGNLIFDFHASLSDGFDASKGSFGLWNAPLLATGNQSWSYRLIAGADISAADSHQLLNAAELFSGAGSILVGSGSPALPTGATNSRSSVIPNYYQTIRSGTGDIELLAAGDVQLLNPLATIYTAGTRAADIANFDTPMLVYFGLNVLGAPQAPIYPAQYSLGGGNVTISAMKDIAHYVLNPNGNGQLIPDSSKELPTNWLYRRGSLNTSGAFATGRNGDIASTSWWIDFSNFFEGVGALGGGNVTLTAGANISNVDAFVPTNARMTKQTPSGDALASHQTLYELGGGDLVVHAGQDIDGGAYYVERGQGTLRAGGSIHTNSTRAAISQDENASNQFAGLTAPPSLWLPTALFLGKGSFDLSATGDILAGPAANPFLLPAGINNGFFNKSYFTTYAASDAIAVTSLTGSITIKNNTDLRTGSLADWFQNVFALQNGGSYGAISQPWLRLAESQVSVYATISGLMPPALQATAFSGDINIAGRVTLIPSPTGTIELLAAHSINGVQLTSYDIEVGKNVWTSSLINLSDADPNRLPSISSPISSATVRTNTKLVTAIDNLFAETGSTIGIAAIIRTKQALHAPTLLHANDFNPVRLYASAGDISGTTLFSGKFAHILAGQDITDISLYLQNDRSTDVSVVSSGRDLVAYDPNSTLRQAAQTSGNELLFAPGFFVPASGSPTAGDLQISGPGTLEVLAGRNLDLGVGPNSPDGTGLGLLSIGNARNPYLPFAGADIVAGAGIGLSSGLAQSQLDFTGFISQFLSASSPDAVRYFSELTTVPGLTPDSFKKLTPEEQDKIALDIFYLVLRDAGRDRSLPGTAGFQNYNAGTLAIATLFPKSGSGDISLTSREIKTKSGGNISLFAPGGKLTVGLNSAGTQALDQGILTEDGGNISIFTEGNVDVGTSRIFTLRGGNEIIWSSTGNIAAGASSKTVQSAPPTRVLVDPQSGDVQTDLAGLATGGGIGVLDTVVGVPPGDVDLIAPVGTVDAGDAGIRVSGNLNIAAAFVLNASNIQASGTSAGVPTVTAPSVNLAGLTAASNTSAASSSAATDASKAAQGQGQQNELPSIITVEVLGYGG